MCKRVISVEKLFCSSILKEDNAFQAMPIDVEANDWRVSIINYLKNPRLDVDIKVKRRAVHYFLVDGKLMRKGANEFILKFPSKVKALKLMKQVRSGLCGAYQARNKMR